MAKHAAGMVYDFDVSIEMPRVIVLLDELDLPRWQVTCLNCMRELDGYQLVGLVTPDHADNVGGKPQGIVKRIRSYLLPSALRRAPGPSWLAGLNSRTCKVIKSRFRERFHDQDINWMRSLSPDVILRFGFGILVGEVLDVAPNGVWSFHHGDLERYRGRPPAFWEILNSEARVGIILQRLTDRLDNGLVIAQGYVPVVPWSPRKTMQVLYECGPHLLKRALLQLKKGGSLEMTAPAKLGRLYRNPGLIDIIRFMFAVFLNTCRWMFEKSFYEFSWKIGRIPTPPLDGDVELMPEWIQGPAGGFLADPGSVPGANDTVLVEHFNRDTLKGVISSLRGIEGDLSEVRVTTLLDLERHLSFPQVYHVDDKFWLVPETANHGKQLAFELDAALCVRNPDNPMVVQGLYGVDPVLFFNDGLWWAFTSPGGSLGGHLLNAFYSTSFLGPYKPHDANPVVIDPYGARPAGAVVERDGKLFRFGQVIERRYGQGIDVFEIAELSTYYYKEKRVARLRLKPDANTGTHGIALYSWGAMVDGYRMRFSIWAGVRRIRARCRSNKRSKEEQSR